MTDLQPIYRITKLRYDKHYDTKKEYVSKREEVITTSKNRVSSCMAAAKRENNSRHKYPQATSRWETTVEVAEVTEFRPL